MITFREYMTRSNYANGRKRAIYQVAQILMNLFFVPQQNQKAQTMRNESTIRNHAKVNTENWWKSTDSPLIPWLQKHGVRFVPGQLPPFAEGGAGRAYFLGDRVVKMSANQVEANVAEMVKGRSDLPTPIIDVLTLQPGLYAILQYYVEMKTPPMIKKAADYLTMIIDDYPQMQGYPKDQTDQVRICQEILQRHGGNTSLLPYMMLILQVLITLYQATGFRHDDAGPTNIGMHQGKVVIPDLGPNEGGDFDPKKSLSQIDQNRSILGLPNREKTI